jgi:hypothetical protein
MTAGRHLLWYMVRAMIQNKYFQKRVDTSRFFRSGSILSDLKVNFQKKGIVSDLKENFKKTSLL